MFSFFSKKTGLGVLDRFSDFSCFQGRIFGEQLFMQHCHFGDLRIEKNKKKIKKRHDIPRTQCSPSNMKSNDSKKDYVYEDGWRAITMSTRLLPDLPFFRIDAMFFLASADSLTKVLISDMGRSYVFLWTSDHLSHSAGRFRFLAGEDFGLSLRR